LLEAVDALQAAAVELGLVGTIGQDQVQAIIADAFQPIRQADERAEQAAAAISAAREQPVAGGERRRTDDEYEGLSTSFARACQVADARLRKRSPLEPIAIVAKHGVPTEEALQCVYERSIERRSQYGLARSTIDVAEYLVRENNPDRFQEWLMGHNPRERTAIVEHIDRKAKS
jgi:hypothetical protein